MVSLSSELASLFDAERNIPPAPEALQRRLWDTLAATLGWLGPAGGGGGLLGGTGALLSILVVLAGLGTVGYFTLGAPNSSRRDSPASAFVGAKATTPGLQNAERSTILTPSWFGEASRPARGFAGHVYFQGTPLAGARVVLQSDLSQARVRSLAESITDDEGGFAFGAQHPVWYEISASAPGKGYGSILIASHDPTAKTDSLEIRLSGCEHVLHGVVSDASGGTIVGAEIQPVHAQWPLAVGVQTDGDGHYEMCTAAGDVQAVISAQGYGAVRLSKQVIGRREVDVELVPESVVVGRVVRADDGGVLPGMAIRVQPAAWSPAPIHATRALTISNGNGEFRLEGLSPGRHTIVAESREWASRPVTVLAEAGVESREIVLHAETRGVVSGKVVLAGKPLAGAKVAALLDGWRRGTWEISDANGAFTLPRLADGPIELVVEGYRVVAPLQYEVTTPPSKPLVLKVESAGSIAGRVVMQGEPVNNAIVQAESPELRRPLQTPSAENGSFHFTGLAAGNYTITASSSARQAFATKDAALTIDLGDREQRGDLILSLDGQASIGGRVVDQDNRALAGAVVEYAHETSGERCSTITDKLGGFVCGPLAGAARYQASVRPELNSALHFPLLSESQVLLGDATSKRTGQVLRVRAKRNVIRGRVVGRDGSPYPDSRVRAIESATGYTPATAPRGGLQSTITGARGAFTITAWAGAEYTLHAQAPSGAEGAVLGIQAGANDVLIRIDEAGAIAGTLVGFTSTPTLLVRRLGNTVDFVEADVGIKNFSVQGLPPGSYAIMALAGSQGATHTVSVRAAQTTEVTLDAGPGATLALQVIDYVTGAPVAGVRCQAAPFIEQAGIAGWGTPLAPPTDLLGGVRFDVPAGPVEVYCQSRRLQHSEGAARLVAAAPGPGNSLIVPLIVSETPADRANGIGAALLMGFLPGEGGFIHTVAKLRPGGAAEVAGLRVGDRVVAVNSLALAPLTDTGMERLLGTYALGDRVQLTIERGATTAQVSVVIEAL